MSEVDKALAEVIQRAVQGMDSAVQFLSTEIPDVLHQLLLWKFTESLLYFVFGVLQLVLGSCAVYKWARYCLAKYSETRNIDWQAGAIFPSFVAMVVLLIVMVHTVNITWVQILVAPKVYLIEYASRLVQ